MTKSGSMVGLFLLREGSTAAESNPVLARIEGQLYALAFSNAQHVARARAALGLDGARPFYVCTANSDQVLRELRAAGARGFIVDYDSSSETFSSAGAIPNAA